MPEPKIEPKTPVGQERLNEHQKELAQAGYRVPEGFYVKQELPQESAEEESGDGGKKAADIDQESSEHGQAARGVMIDRAEHEANIAAAEQQRATEQEALAKKAQEEREAARTARLKGGEKAGKGPAANKAAKGPAENKSATEAGALDGVDFASAAAREAAEEAGLTPADFKRKSKSSDSGFTKGDVEEIAAAKGE